MKENFPRFNIEEEDTRDGVEEYFEKKWNLQDTRTIIDFLKESDLPEEVTEKPVDDIEIKTQEELEHENEVKKIAMEISNPLDILKLSKKDRKIALSVAQENQVEKFKNLSMLKKELFDFLENINDGAHEVDVEKTKEEVLKIADKYGFLNQKFRSILKKIASSFVFEFNQRNKFKEMSKEELLKKFIRNDSNLSLMKGDYSVNFGAYSINFTFENKDDYLLFISHFNGKDDDNKKSMGMAYVVDGTQIIAMTSEGESNDYGLSHILKHENQHKKSELIDDAIKWEGAGKYHKTDYDNPLREDSDMREEILSFLSQENTHFDDLEILPYGSYMKRSGLFRNSDKTMVKNAVEAVKNLSIKGYTRDEILGIFSSEPLLRWPRIERRFPFAGDRKERKHKFENTDKYLTVRKY